MIVKLLTEHHLEFLSLKGGCRGSSESTRVKMPHFWKSHVTAHINCIFTSDDRFHMALDARKPVFEVCDQFKVRTGLKSA